MNQKVLTKTFMMISNWKKPFGCDIFYKLIQRFKSQHSAPSLGVTKPLLSMAFANRDKKTRRAVWEVYEKVTPALHAQCSSSSQKVLGDVMPQIELYSINPTCEAVSIPSRISVGVISGGVTTDTRPHDWHLTSRLTLDVTTDTWRHDWTPFLTKDVTTDIERHDWHVTSRLDVTTDKGCHDCNWMSRLAVDVMTDIGRHDWH